ncbi:MAG TPA: MFS transporter, partial [Blastococcus sp.]|nr:MFS transporter [Blastococcus sp.]
LLAGAGLGLLAAAVAAAPVALATLAGAYGLYLGVLVAAEAELQRRITGPYRATITSVAGVGIELSSLLVFTAWALGGPPALGLLVLAAVPLAGFGLRRRD